MKDLKTLMLLAATFVILVISENSNADANTNVRCAISASGYSLQGDLLRVQIRSNTYSSILVEKSGTGETLRDCVLNLDPVGMAQEVCNKKYLTKPKSNARREYMFRGAIYVVEGNSVWSGATRHIESIECSNFPSSH
jgi:hypothetical protein